MFPEMVLLLTVRVVVPARLPLKRPPPDSVPETVLSAIVMVGLTPGVESKYHHHRAWRCSLDTVVFLSVRGPWLEMPPPELAVLSRNHAVVEDKGT